MRVEPVTLASAIVLLILIIDPFGSVPFFVSALKDVAPERRRIVVVRELLIAYVVMVAFLFAGQPLLRVLGISGPALTIAGGVILFLIALRMVFPMRGQTLQEDLQGEPLIVPLAITVAWAGTALVVFFGSQVTERLGPRGLVAIERLMGMVLVAIAIQMFLTGADQYFGRA